MVGRKKKGVGKAIAFGKHRRMQYGGFSEGLGNAYSSRRHLYGCIDKRNDDGRIVLEGIEFEVPSDMLGGIIILSTDVNAKDIKVNALVNWFKKKITTLRNRISWGRKTSGILKSSEGVQGWTIGRFLRGRYIGNHGEVFDENSLSVEIVGISFDNLIKVAENLCREFNQESVLVKTYDPKRVLFVNADDSSTGPASGGGNDVKLESAQERVKPVSKSRMLVSLYKDILDILGRDMGFWIDDVQNDYEKACEYFGIDADANSKDKPSIVAEYAFEIGDIPHDREGWERLIDDAFPVDEDGESNAKFKQRLDSIYGRKSVHEALEEVIPTNKAINFLIKDENEAVDGYDKAIKMFNDAAMPLVDAERIIDVLQHIKEEELEHIRELKALAKVISDGTGLAVDHPIDGQEEPIGEDGTFDIDYLTDDEMKPLEKIDSKYNVWDEFAEEYSHLLEMVRSEEEED